MGGRDGCPGVVAHLLTGAGHREEQRGTERNREEQRGTERRGRQGEESPESEPRVGELSGGSDNRFAGAPLGLASGRSATRT